MSEVHRYHVVKMLSEGGNRISYDPHGPEVVMASAYDQVKAENEALRKDADRLQSATAFVQKLCHSAGKQPSVATGYLHDILSALGQGERS